MRPRPRRHISINNHCHSSSSSSATTTVFSARQHICTAVMEMGQWVMDHGSKWVTILEGLRGSWFTVSDPLTHDDDITAQ